jgi:hypothetical protein
MSQRKFTDDQVEKALKDRSCISVAATLRKLGANPHSGTHYATIRGIVQKRSIDTSHWLGQGHLLGKLGNRKPAALSLKVYGPSEKCPSAHKIKNKLIRDGLKAHQCEQCKLSQWLNSKIPIELHHRNGNKRDFTFDNLQILCPNCHALTPNYAGKNKRCNAVVATISADVVKPE